MSRMFIALALPDKLKLRLSSLRSAFPSLKWLSPQTQHLTLRFLGEITEAAEIGMCLREIKFAPFTLHICGLGLFERRNGSILWAGIIQEKSLLELRHSVDQALANAGLNLKNETFKPHITLGRLKGPIDSRLKKTVAARRGENFGDMAVGEFSLFTSALHPEGAIHAVFETYRAR